MKLYIIVLKNILKANRIYKLNYFATVFYPILFIVLRVSIWKALYTYGDVQTPNDINLQNMIAYTIISQFLIAFVITDIMNDMNQKILKGDICHLLLLPVNIISYEFWTSFMESILKIVYFAVFPFSFSVVVYGLCIDVTAMTAFLFLISSFLAFILFFLYSFIMGISAIWLRNSFFLSNLDEAIFSLLSGMFVPIWFFPRFIDEISKFFPFRYMLFEPISILLGKSDIELSIKIIFIQLLFVFGMGKASSYLWTSAKEHISIYGG